MLGLLSTEGKMVQPLFQVTWNALDLPAPTPPDGTAPIVVQGNGVALDYSQGFEPSCQVELVPYPAPGVGAFTVYCTDCKLRLTVMTQGVTTDPMSITVACLATPTGLQYLFEDNQQGRTTG
jgi:hypothetical protein